MTNTIFKYPLDLLGTSLDNKVIDEQHTIGSVRGRIFAADYGPFFGNSVDIRDGVTGRELQPNTDYVLVHYYREAADASGQAVYAAVRIVNPEVSTDILFTAQQVGGEFSFSYYALQQAIQDLQNDNRPVNWGDLIGVPSTFVPAPHTHSAYDLYGMKYLVEANYDIANAIREGDAASRAMLINQLRQKLEVIDTYLEHWRSDFEPKVVEIITIPAGGVHAYDLVTILGADHLTYNKLGADVQVRVRNTDETSPTYNLFISCQQVLTIGLNAAGVVKLVNYYTKDLEFSVVIKVPRAA